MGRLIGLAHSILRQIENLFAVLAGVVVLVIMALGVAEVIGRSAFRAPIHGSLDMVEQLMVVAAAFGIAYCQAHWGNVRMTLILSRATGRSRWLLEALSLVVACFVVFALAKGGWDNFLRTWEIGGNTPNIYLPLWPGILAVFIALCLLLVRLFLQLIEALWLIINPDAPTITAPDLNPPHK